MTDPQDNETIEAFSKLNETAFGKKVVKHLATEYEQTKEELVTCSLENFSVIQGEARVLRQILELAKIRN